MSDAIHWVVAGEHGDVPGGGAWDTYKFFDDEPISAAATVDSWFGTNSPGMVLGQFQNFGLYGVLTGATPDVTFSLLESYDNVDAHYAAPDVGSSIVQITDTNPHIVTVTPTPMGFFRIRAVGGAGNGANVRANVWIWIRT